ncbi:hypothetical protein GCM10022384_55580 [Streptomyces marokkonensis]|uniref:Uncharacterized protein n=1 Tax=Streptomyces marokkonensis TaxID=324855 RepID=A0ABP7RSP9_9ACTN
MAVVLRDLDGRTIHAGFVKSGDDLGDFVRLDGATGSDEENAVTSPDGRSVELAHRLLSTPVEDRLTHVAGAPVHCPVAACGSRVN